jgi:hypothetical protein
MKIINEERTNLEILAGRKDELLKEKKERKIHK